MKHPLTRTNTPHATGGRPAALVKGSPLYTMMADAVTYIYAYPSTVAPAMHKVGGYAVGEHDRVFDGRVNPVGFEHEMSRFYTTQEIVFGIVFGGPESADIAYALRELHRGVHGVMPDGEKYHAWNPRLWRWFWMSSVSSYMNIYDTFRGYPSREFRESVYTGFIELGQLFGVKDMPTSFDEFSVVWPQERDLFAASTPEGCFLADQLSSNMFKPTYAQWIPKWIWVLLTLPLRRTFRMALIAGFPAVQYEMIGIKANRIDAVELALHKLFWRLVPVALSSRFAPIYFYLRGHYGTPSWRRHYSRSQLDQRRERKAAAEATPSGVYPISTAQGA